MSKLIIVSDRDDYCDKLAKQHPKLRDAQIAQVDALKPTELEEAVVVCENLPLHLAAHALTVIVTNKDGDLNSAANYLVLGGRDTLAGAPVSNVIRSYIEAASNS